MSEPLTRRPVFRSSVVIAIAVATLAATATANAECFPLQGRIRTSFTTKNCTSPVGLCTVGLITGAGPLDSTTTFVALAAAPLAGIPTVEPPANLSYSGVITIHARRGTLITHDLGVVDAGTKTFTELERPASGTGIFKKGGNVFFISGSLVNRDRGSAASFMANCA